MTKLTYCYTSYGDVIPGLIFNEPQFPGHTVLIQASKLKDYLKLQNHEKSIDVVNKYGHAIPNAVIVRSEEVSLHEYRQGPNKKPVNGWNGSYDRKTMIIFGAGASANCVFGNEKVDFKKDRSCPPLGPSLFDKRFEHLYNKYSGVLYNLYRLQGMNGVDVEALFEEDWKEIAMIGNPHVMARHINIQYYLQELLHYVSFSTILGYTHNLYMVMADKLIKAYYPLRTRKFAFVSFNQDTILELVLSRAVGMQFEKINDYSNINEGAFSVYKPHGSWNWGWEIANLPPPGNTADFLFKSRITLHDIYYKMLGNPEVMVDWEGYGLNSQLHVDSIGKMTVNKDHLKVMYPGNENIHFPALLLPYRDKDEFTMPSSHYLDMYNYLPYVETLVVIGWKGNEQLFNRILEQQGRNIKKLIIADPNWRDVIANLSFFHKPSVELITYEGGFEEFVLNKMDEDLGLI